MLIVLLNFKHHLMLVKLIVSFSFRSVINTAANEPSSSVLLTFCYTFNKKIATSIATSHCYTFNKKIMKYLHNSNVNILLNFVQKNSTA